MKEEVSKKLEEMGIRIWEQIEKMENPSIDIPIRSLSNVVFDEKTKSLTLGNKKAKRYFFHVAHSKKFMQTLLVASFCKELIDHNLHTSLRDLFYALKRTLPNSHENTFDEQKESDPIIVDLEVALDVLREQLHLNADVRGRVVGDVVIKDRGDRIDWSKLGSGGWAIPSNVEDIEFKKINADFVLVVEKNAAFERLHEDKFWKKHKCILLTTQGQAARGVRRLIQRLSTEFELPVYVFTDADSIPPWEVVIVRDKVSKEIFIDKIENLLKKFFDENKEREIVDVPFEVLSMTKDGKIEWKEVEYAYRHRIKGKLLKIKTRGRGVIEVTPAHSLFVYKNGKIEVAKASELKEGDYIVISKSLPKLKNKKKALYIAEILKKLLADKELKKIKVIYKDGSSDSLLNTKNLRHVKYLKHVNGRQIIKNKITIDEDFGWLFGLWIAEGSLDEKYIRFSLSGKESELARKVKKIFKKKFNVKANVYKNKKKCEIRIYVSSSLLAKFMKGVGFCSGSRKKNIPNIFFNANKDVQIGLIKGMIDGDGHIDKYYDIVYFTTSETLAKQLSILLLSLNSMPTIVKTNKGLYVRLPFTRIDENIREKLTGRLAMKVRYTSDSIYGLPNQGFVKTTMISMMNNYGIPYSIKSSLINQKRFMDAVENFGIDIRNLGSFKNMITLVKIKKIEEKNYDGYVYDFGVPETNSFIGGNGIVFHNSYGWYIYSVIKYGSISLAHISDRLGTPTAKFLGLTISDIDKFKLHNWTIKAKEVDIKRAKELMKYKWFKHPKWQKELKLMIQRKIKAELEALSGKGLRFVTETYLPEKIENQDFLP